MAQLVGIYYDDDWGFYLSPGEVDLTDEEDRVISWKNETGETFRVTLPLRLGGRHAEIKPGEEEGLDVANPPGKGVFRYKCKSLSSGVLAQGNSDPRIRT